MTTNRGPRASTLCPAETRFSSPVSSFASLSFITRPSIRRKSAISSSCCSRIHRSIVSATTSLAVGACARTPLWVVGGGGAVGQENKLTLPERLGQRRPEVTEDVQVHLQRLAVVHVGEILPLP